MTHESRIIRRIENGEPLSKADKKFIILLLKFQIARDELYKAANGIPSRKEK